MKIIGCVGVPTALILPPLATTKAEALAPVPGFPLITVPACMVNSCPEFTNTKPSNKYILSFVQVVVPVPPPLSEIVTTLLGVGVGVGLTGSGVFLSSFLQEVKPPAIPTHKAEIRSKFFVFIFFIFKFSL